MNTRSRKKNHTGESKNVPEEGYNGDGDENNAGDDHTDHSTGRDFDSGVNQGVRLCVDG